MDLSKLLQSVSALSPTPQILPRLRKLLDDPNSSRDDIIKLLNVDAALTARIIHQSNSAFIGASVPARNLGESINRLGYGHVYKVVSVAAAQCAVSSALPVYQMGKGMLFQGSLAAATLMKQIGRKSSVITEDDDTLYTIGLLHGIGKMIINHYVTRNPGEVAITPNVEMTPEVERQKFGVTYAQVGAALLKQWRYPPEIIKAINDHLNPFKEPVVIQLACALFIARTSIPKVLHSADYTDFGWDGERRYIDELQILPDDIPSIILNALREFRELSTSVK